MLEHTYLLLIRNILRFGIKVVFEIKFNAVNSIVAAKMDQTLSKKMSGTKTS